MEASPSPNAAGSLSDVCDLGCGTAYNATVPDTRTIFVVDWDGTCTEDGWPKQGAWIDGAQEALRSLLLKGRVKIFSSRLNPYRFGHDGELLRDEREVEADVQAIRAVLDSAGLDEVEIHTTHGKPTGHYYIDNRGIEFSGSWDEVLAKIEAAERGYLTPWACIEKTYGGLWEFVTTNAGPIPEEEELTDLGEALRRMSDGVTYWKSNADGSGYEEIIDCGPKTRYIDPETGGSKEESQARFDLVPPDALALLARVYGYGEGKYPSGPDGPNYLRGYPWHLSIASVERHIQKFKAGESIDPESGLHHLAHAAWHCFTLIAFELRGLGKDDRVFLSDAA